MTNPIDQPSASHRLRRREFFRLLGFGAAGSGVVGLSPSIAARSISTTAALQTPPQTEGPFYFDTALRRTDIAEGNPGIPLRVQLRVLSVSSGQPVQNADVAIWHATASGIYSGYAPNGFQLEQTSGRSYCRGVQTTDNLGRVAFDTIYPGWYVVRTPHIHVKERVAGQEVLTTQLYFDEIVNDDVFDIVQAYGGRGVRPVRNNNDGGFDTRLLFSIEAHPGSFTGSFDLCIA